MAAWRASGQSAREFAEGRDFSVHMLRYWANRVEKEAVAPGPDTAVRLAPRGRHRQRAVAGPEHHAAAFRRRRRARHLGPRDVRRRSPG